MNFSEVEGIWQTGFLAVTCHTNYGMLNEKHYVNVFCTLPGVLCAISCRTIWCFLQLLFVVLFSTNSQLELKVCYTNICTKHKTIIPKLFCIWCNRSAARHRGETELKQTYLSLLCWLNKSSPLSFSLPIMCSTPPSRRPSTALTTLIQCLSCTSRLKTGLQNQLHEC